MACDWLYTLSLYDENGESETFLNIESQIRDIVTDVSRRVARGERAVPVGILSSDHRDTWAAVRTLAMGYWISPWYICHDLQNRKHLLFLSHKNHEVKRAIEDSLFFLCLDNYTYGKDTQAISTGDPELDNHSHNIRSGRSARNRWFDKPYSLILESNSRAGVMGEHSPVDALVPSMVADYSLLESFPIETYGPPDAFPDTKSSSSSTSTCQWLEWVVDEYIREQCKLAELRANAIIEDSDSSVLWFDNYGTRWIKDHGEPPLFLFSR